MSIKRKREGGFVLGIKRKRERVCVLFGVLVEKEKKGRMEGGF